MEPTLKQLGFVFIALAAVAGCVTGDLNTPCTLVRGNPDGGRAIDLLESDPIVKNSANKDFISFGSTECEDQVCVRDSAYSTDGGAEGPARGYCSRSCVANSSVGCPSASGQLDSEPKTKLSCRALILDEATLAAIKAKDPSTYQRVFGMTTSPFFCARGGPQDGGR